MEENLNKTLKTALLVSIFVFTFVIVFISCNPNSSVITAKSNTTNIGGDAPQYTYDVLIQEPTIDGCEYIVCRTINGVCIIHKPRCRKCVL